MQVRALSTIVELKPGEIINRWYFHLPLTDVLLDLLEKDPQGPDAAKLSRIARAFAHDVLHIATLAGRLFWYEGMTPNMKRSEDLVAISVDTENYLMLLRTACDIVASAWSIRSRGTPSRSNTERFFERPDCLGEKEPAKD